MACYCFLRNVVDVCISAAAEQTGADADVSRGEPANVGKTAYESRFGRKFGGPTIPFGAEVRYLPITDKDKERGHKFGDKLLAGIFMGYDQRAGGGWSGDLLVVDWEELENAERTL